MTNRVSHVHHALHKVVNNAKPTIHTWANHALIKPDRRKVPLNQPHQPALVHSAPGSQHVRRMRLLVAHKAIVQPLAVNAAANRNTKLYLNRGAILIGSAIIPAQQKRRNTLLYHTSFCESGKIGASAGISQTHQPLYRCYPDSANGQIWFLPVSA